MSHSFKDTCVREYELRSLDLNINGKKSVCIPIGPRWYADCAELVTSEGAKLQWVTQLRYLGIYILSGKTFRCCFDEAKKSFYRAFNAIYGKIGTVASEEVILSLIKTKCLSCLLYGIHGGVSSEQNRVTVSKLHSDKSFNENFSLILYELY